MLLIIHIIKVMMSNFVIPTCSIQMIMVEISFQLSSLYTNIFTQVILIVQKSWELYFRYEYGRRIFFSKYHMTRSHISLMIKLEIPFQRKLFIFITYRRYILLPKRVRRIACSSRGCIIYLSEIQAIKYIKQIIL